MEGQEVARGSGILLAVSSLPSEYGIGTLGDAAFHFVDLLVDLKQKYWQVLPVGPTSFGDSPYQSLSAFAGNPYLIDLDQLVREKLLTPEEIQNYYWGTQKSAIDYAALFENRTLVLQKAFGRFDEHEPEFQQFVEENRDWVEDYGLYMALKVSNGNQNWQSWPENIQKKQPVALAKCRKEMYNNIMFWVFCQYKFFQQWGKLREYANSKGIQLIGDVPFYSTINKHLTLFDWVGLANFKTVLGLGGKIGKTFWRVLGWTIVWAVFATFLCNFLGLILAIVINRKETKCKAFWRTCFVISIAVPQFVSLLVMRQMLQEHGAINNLLMEWGLIQNPLPFWTNTMWARVSVILINCWVGIPYTMLQVTGVLQNVPAELYEAAKIDGANAAQIFRKITLPYIMFIMGPYIITQFTGNINNFNVIYLLSAGKPTPVGETAGKTDLLVTWLYKLTVDYQYYNIGAVIGILTFVVLSIVALVTYRNTKAYKDEEGFM